LKEYKHPAANIPTYRIAPPNYFRIILAFSINNADPAIIDPTGAPNPLLTQNITVSQYYEISWTDTFKYIAALNILAPSRWIGILWFYALIFIFYVINI
jgi:hypothetical protein